ncbi:hypothetical protein AAFF_G00335450 [Aldrovandia affinis]|uniref:Uncharacterized protein n=1 Tax=Aldrovandia affinis TaxID=143900 RepID=A0AAD7WPM5_9TELE|nr:hypothetical protein AAFF_G00335450 [Aldrovandia affinis]
MDHRLPDYPYCCLYHLILHGMPHPYWENRSVSTNSSYPSSLLSPCATRSAIPLLEDPPVPEASTAAQHLPPVANINSLH